jgi:hypothetical protein
MPFQPRLISLSRAGICDGCGHPVPAGERAWWTRGKPTVMCLSCRPADRGPSAQPGVERHSAATEEAAPVAPAEIHNHGPLSKADLGVAGASAMREFERRHGKREERVRARWGRMAGLVLALTEDPSSTRAWARGSVGETKLGRSLATLQRDDIIVLHDRRVPATRGNIDHIVVCPSGIYVIDAKRYAGRVEVRDVGGWFRRDLRLMVGGRDRSPLARKMDWQMAAVRQALGDADVPLQPVLCFVDAEWPLVGAPDQFEGVRIEGTRSLRRLVARDGPLDADDVADAAALLARALPACLAA